ncbi:MAG: GNAT family N-acetyltransferase [Firmicutes bacterium]|nr:GNAT family N-acetyltransferase [Bacillota bacterium]
MPPLAEVLASLRKDPVRNANLINFIENYPPQSILRVGASVLVRGTSDKPWVYISSSSPTEFGELLRKFTPAEKNFAVLEDWMVPPVVAGRAIKQRLTCIKLYLPEEVAVEPPRNQVTPLRPEEAEYLYDHALYREFTDVAYIRERIARGIGFGIHEAGKLTAWALTHDDGAIGFLHVLPPYRGRGFARDVSAAIIHRLRAEGKIPFVHIEEENIASLGLAGKLGFVKDRRVHWIELA